MKKSAATAADFKFLVVWLRPSVGAAALGLEEIPRIERGCWPEQRRRTLRVLKRSKLSLS